MSYDLYCYKSNLRKPDLGEAKNIIETEVDQPGENVNQEIRNKIKEALLNFNPRLECFDFDYDEVATLEGISIEEARQRHSYIELNTPDGDLATQITIHQNMVVITIPYWYSGAKVKEVFEMINHYLSIVSETAGYFVYDPQIELAFDPLLENIVQINKYSGISIESVENHNEGYKPWWKFW